MSAQNFNFTPKFSQNAGLFAPSFASLDENFSTKRFSDDLGKEPRRH